MQDINQEFENFLHRSNTRKCRKASEQSEYFSNKEKENSSELEEDRQNRITERMFKQMMTSSEDQNSARALSDFMEHSSVVGKNYLSFGEKEEEKDETENEIEKIRSNSIIDNNTTKEELARRDSRINEVEALDTYNECYISDNLCKNANSVHTVEESDKVENEDFHESKQEKEVQESGSSSRLRKKHSINKWINENNATKIEETKEEYFNKKQSFMENLIKKENTMKRENSSFRRDGSMRRRSSTKDINIMQREKSMNLKNNGNRENILERESSQDRLNIINEENSFIKKNTLKREKSMKRENSVKRENSMNRKHSCSKGKNTLKRKGTGSISVKKKDKEKELKVKYIYKNYSSIPLPQTEKTGFWLIDTINAMLDKLCDINKKDYYLNSLDIIESYPNDDVQYVTLTEQFKVKWPDYLRFSNLIHYSHILGIYEKVFKNDKQNETPEQRSKDYKSQELHSRKSRLESKNIPLPKFQGKHCKDRCALKQYENLPELKIFAKEDSKSTQKGDALIQELWKKCVKKIENKFEEISTKIAEKIQKINSSNITCLVFIKKVITLMLSFVQNGKYITKVPKCLSVLFGSIYACIQYKKEEEEETVEQIMNTTNVLNYNKPEPMVSVSFPMQKAVSAVTNASAYQSNQNIHEPLNGLHANALNSSNPEFSTSFHAFHHTSDQFPMNDSQPNQKKEISKETKQLKNSNIYTNENQTHNIMQVNRTHSSSHHSNENISNGNISNYPVLNYMDTKGKISTAEHLSGNIFIVPNELHRNVFSPKKRSKKHSCKSEGSAQSFCLIPKYTRTCANSRNKIDRECSILNFASIKNKVANSCMNIHADYDSINHNVCNSTPTTYMQNTYSYNNNTSVDSLSNWNDLSNRTYMKKDSTLSTFAEVHPNWQSQNLYYTAASFPEQQESTHCTTSYTKQTTQLQNPEYVDCNNNINDKYY